MWPKITVVTPNLNGGSTLQATIDSVVNQRYPNLEYIVVDGGSTDNSLEVIYENARHIDVFLRGRDRNLYDGIAKGFEYASGHVLAWLNSDDLYEPGALPRVGEIFRQNPRWDVIYFDGVVLKSGWRIPNRPQKAVAYPELLAGHILYQDAVFFTRQAYESAGGLDRVNFRLAGDYDLWLRLSSRYDFHYIPETVSCFRLRDGQLSGDWTAYLKEMQVAQRLAKERAASGPHKAAGAAARRRTSAAIDRKRRFFFPLANENERWIPVHPRLPGPRATCTCPSCGKTPVQLLFSQPDCRRGRLESWPVLLCRQCRHAVTHPHPDAEELPLQDRRGVAEPGPSRLYLPYARTPMLFHSGLYPALASRFPGKLGGRGDLCRVEADKRSRVLDFGSGEGRMLAHLRGLGLESITGHESHPVFCRRLRQAGYTVLRGEFLALPLPEERFDVITMHRSLETLADPVTVLRRLAEWLTPGGRIVISTPNLDSIWAERYGPVWSQWKPPLHLHIFSPTSLRRVALHAGLRVRSWRTTSPADWLAGHEQNAPRGCAGYLAGPPPLESEQLARACEGASIASAIRWDWLGRGDCLHAVLSR